VPVTVGVQTVGGISVFDRISGRSFPFVQLFDVLVVQSKEASS